jgi:predicted  nucleic acid-binding Zn-ribbon protein
VIDRTGDSYIDEALQRLLVGSGRLSDGISRERHLRELHAVEDECSRKVGELEREITELRWRRDQLERDNLHLKSHVRQATTAIPAAMWKKIAALCHPDKHSNSKAATEVMQWLNSVRP